MIGIVTQLAIIAKLLVIAFLSGFVVVWSDDEQAIRAQRFGLL